MDINAAVKLIENNLGGEFARLYQEFYKDKTNEEILVSVRELLSEVVGPEMADEQVNNLKNEQKNN